MTEIFVSGTEVFSDAKMTETPYECRRVDRYAGVNNQPLHLHAFGLASCRHY